MEKWRDIFDKLKSRFPTSNFYHLTVLPANWFITKLFETAGLPIIFHFLVVIFSKNINSADWGKKLRSTNDLRRHVYVQWDLFTLCAYISERNFLIPFAGLQTSNIPLTRTSSCNGQQFCAQPDTKTKTSSPVNSTKLVRSSNDTKWDAIA